MRAHAGRYELRRWGNPPERGAPLTFHDRDEAFAMLSRAVRRPEDVSVVRRHLAQDDLALHHLTDDAVLREAARRLTQGRSALFFVPDLSVPLPQVGEDEEVAAAPYEPEAGFGFVADIDVGQPPLFSPSLVADAPLRVEPAIVFEPPPRMDARSARGAPADEEARDPRTGAPLAPAEAVDTFVEIQMIGEDGAPLAGARYRLVLTDGTVAEGRLDGEGVARVAGIPEGKCTVSFPDLDSDAWEPA